MTTATKQSPRARQSGTSAPLSTANYSTPYYQQIRIGRRHSAALLEVDVTRARSCLRARNRGAASAVSLLAWLARCVAASLARHPQISTGRSNRRHNGSDAGPTVSLMVEREVEGVRLPLPIVVSSIDARSLPEIEAAIIAARTGSLDAKTVLKSASRNRFAVALYNVLPGPLRRRVVRRVLQGGKRISRTGGVAVASVGMGGRVKGWFVPRTAHAICIGIGAVTPKATVVNGTIEAREVLHIAVLVDHSIVTGSDTARWVSDLVRNLEQAKELGDWQN